MERKLRLALTMLAISLGIGFVSGTYILTDSIERAFEDLFDRVVGSFDVVVRVQPAFRFSERDRIPATVLDEVEKIEGVRAAEGSVEGLGTLVDQRGQTIGGQGPPTIIASYSESFQAAGTRIVAGRPPTKLGEVMLDKYTADRREWDVGDEIQAVIKGPVHKLRIVGLYEVGGLASFGGAQILIFDLDSAQKLLDKEGSFDSIAIKGDLETQSSDLKLRLERRLPDNYEVTARSGVVGEISDQIKEGIGFLTNALLVFAFTALFVGAFLIFNTFSILFAQRLREFALLRAIGSTSGQILRVVVAESALIGAAASAAGIGVGFGIAAGMRAVFSRFGGQLPNSGLPLLPRTIAVSMVLGTIVTLVASIYPAFKATRVAPLAAVREAAPRARRNRSRTITAVTLGLVGIALMAGALFSVPESVFTTATRTLTSLGVGAAIVFIAVAIGIPAFASPAARALGRPLAGRGVVGKIARENAARDPNRIAATAAALMIGVALISFVTILAASLKQSAEEGIDERLVADFILLPSGDSRIDPGLASKLEELPGIGMTTGLRFGPSGLAGSPAGALGVEPSKIERALFFDVKQGRLSDLSAGGIAVFEELAKEKGWKLGTKLQVVYPKANSETHEVKAIFAERPSVRANFGSDHLFAADYLLSAETFDKHFIEVNYWNLYATVAKSSTPGNARAAIESTLKGYPAIRLLDQSELKRLAAQRIERALRLINVLLGLALVIAVFGIVNTLVLSVIERTREIGLMRAVGVTRRQIRSMIRRESVIVSVFGAILGVVLGIVFAWLFALAQADEGLAFNLPPLRLASFVLATAVAGVIAAIPPARRAARVDLLKAIAYE